MKKILAIAAMFLGYSASAQNTSKLLSEYMNIKNALVSSDSKVTKEAVNTFYQSLKSEKDFTQKADLLKAVEKMTKASGIDKQRDAFNGISTVMWKLVNKSDVTQTVYYQYCPMKKTYWLSQEKEIKNPYYGSSMLTCGKTVETKN